MVVPGFAGGEACGDAVPRDAALNEQRARRNRDDAMPIASRLSRHIVSDRLRAAAGRIGCEPLAEPHGESREIAHVHPLLQVRVRQFVGDEQRDRVRLFEHARGDKRPAAQRTPRSRPSGAP